MKKLVLALSLSLLASTSVFAVEINMKAPDVARALAQVSEKKMVSTDGLNVINAILIGQSYEQRVSVLKASCELGKVTTSRTCTIRIGTDDLNDDDRGWGSVLDIKFEQSQKGTVLKASLSGVAG